MAARLRLLSALYEKHFGDYREERRLLSAVSFFGTFATVRAVTHAIRAGVGPFRNIAPGGRHIHHMTVGIIALLIVGDLWMLEVGTATDDRLASRLTSTSYGAGAALTLDEFALWLNLEDVYWAKQGRESIDAVVLFGSLLSIGVIGRDFLHELTRIARGLERDEADIFGDGRPDPAAADGDGASAGNAG